jgi:hypothetical protein
MPIEICARDPAGIEMSAPARRALKRNRIPEVFIRNRLFSPFVAAYHSAIQESRSHQRGRPEAVFETIEPASNFLHETLAPQFTVRA